MLKEPRKRKYRKWTIKTLEKAIGKNRISRGEYISLANQPRDNKDAWVISEVIPLLPQLCNYHVKLDLSNNQITSDEAIAIARCLEQCTEGSLELNLSHNGNYPLLVFTNILPHCSIRLLINFTDIASEIYDNTKLLSFIKDTLIQPLKHLVPVKFLLMKQVFANPNCIFNLFPKEITDYITYLMYASPINNLCQNSLFKDYTKPNIPQAGNTKLFFETLQQAIVAKWRECGPVTFNFDGKKLQINFTTPGANLDIIGNYCRNIGFEEFITLERETSCDKKNKQTEQSKMTIHDQEAIKFFAIYVCGLNPDIISLESDIIPQAKKRFGKR